MSSTASQATTGPAVRIDRDGPLALLILDRPQGRNSFDVATLDALLVEVANLVHDREVRAVVLVGTDRFFCTGADVKEMQANSDRAPAHFDDLTYRYHALLAMIRNSDTVFVAALRGIAAGGGVGYALSADLVVAAEDARLILAYGNLGVSPDGGSTSLLTRALGPHRTREAILIDEGVSATQMNDWGLANRVVPADDVLEVAKDLARKAGARARHTVKATKALVERAATQPFTDVLDAERNAIIEAAATADFREGLTAFGEKRKPSFA